MDISLEKIMPNNQEIERNLLGYTLIMGKQDLEIDRNDFYLDSHRRVWDVIQAMTEAGKSPDMVSVIHELQISGQLEACGGYSYILGLTNGIARHQEALSAQYCNILREQHALRLAIQVSNELMAKAYDSQPFRDIVNDAFSQLDVEMARFERKEGPRLIADIIGETFQEIEQIANNKQGNGVKLGFRSIDYFIPQGLQPKEFLVIAGRPASGKSSLMMNIVKNIGKLGVPQVVFSLEMSERQLVLRMIAEAARVPLTKMATGFLSKSDWDCISRACGELCGYKIYIDDSANLTVSDMRSRSRRLPVEPAFIWADYLQLISPPKNMVNRSDVEKISSVSMGLRSLAKIMNCVVGACAQLSRESEKRKDPTPKVSDLRQSGQIEQDADIVLLVHRPEAKEITQENIGLADIIIGKQRSGPAPCTIPMAFSSQYSCFDEIYQDQETPYNDRWYDK